MPDDEAILLTDRDYLQTRQYRTDANLAARQSIYQVQRPRIDLPGVVLDLARLAGTETVADIGCGNGRYLAELARRGHGGRVLGIDMSAGMLHAARATAGAAGLIAADAAALPLPGSVADITLAPHMLYHVPDRQVAARELRRITRDGGKVLVTLNGPDHLAEVRDVATEAAVEFGLERDASYAQSRADGGLNLDSGAELLATVFESVQRYEFRAELEVPEPGPILDYIRSMRLTQDMAEPEGLVAAAARLLLAAGDGIIRVRTQSGCLVCR